VTHQAGSAVSLAVLHGLVVMTLDDAIRQYAVRTLWLANLSDLHSPSGCSPQTSHVEPGILFSPRQEG